MNRFAFIGLAITALIVVFALPSIHFLTSEQITFQVKSLRVIQTGNADARSSKYLVGTESGEVFENSDSMLELKFNSSTVQNKLEEGNCYETKAWGFRVPLFSMYRKIADVKKVSCTRLSSSN
jgi:hypothetical protein